MIIIKTPEEIKLIREACRISARVLLDIEKEIRAGVETQELDRRSEELILKYGGQPAFKGYRGYKYAVCTSVNSEVVHGIPSGLKLKDGDIVGFDIGVIYKGYYGDCAKTFGVGKISPLAQKLLGCAEEALGSAISAAREGGYLGDVSFAIEECAQKYGFTVVKDLFGHGVGKNLHEDPLIPNFGKKGTGPELKSGMVLAVEPMVNAGGHKIVTLDDGWTVVTFDRSLSAHFEHTILVGREKAEILTRA